MLRWPYSMVPCGTGLGEVASSGCAMWHGVGWSGPAVWCHVAMEWWGGPLAVCHVALRWGPPVSDSYLGGAHLLTWPNERLPRGTPSLFDYFIPPVFLVPSLYPELLLSPTCTQDCSDQISAFDYSIYSAFIFPEFILIAPLIQKLWNFHQKSLNSWWSSL